MRKPLPEVCASTRCSEFADCATLRRCGGGDGAPSVSAVGRHFGEASGLGVGSK